MADDVAISEHNFFHVLFGAGSKNLKSTHDTTPIGGFAGWARRDYVLNDPGSWAVKLTP